MSTTKGGRHSSDSSATCGSPSRRESRCHSLIKINAERKARRVRLLHPEDHGLWNFSRRRGGCAVWRLSWARLTVASPASTITGGSKAGWVRANPTDGADTLGHAALPSGVANSVGGAGTATSNATRPYHVKDGNLFQAVGAMLCYEKFNKLRTHLCFEMFHH